MSFLDPIPLPPQLLVGRDAEIARIEAAWNRLPAVVIYGVAGVGKSALAYELATRWSGAIVHVTLAGDPIEGAMDDARRHLGGMRAPELGNPAAVIDDLARRLDAGSALLVVDDVHRASAQDCRVLFRALVGSLRRGRVLATSRQRLPLDPGGPDRLDVRLDGLMQPAALALWRSLDDLYGAVAGFEHAWTRTRGNPFQLRRAHAGWLDDTDPVAAAITARNDNELRWLRAVALSRVPLPASVATALLGDDATPVIRSLTGALMIDVDGTGASTLHDLFRETLLHATDSGARAAIHGALADALAREPWTPALVREIARHLRALGDHARAGQFLVEQTARMVRAGASADLLRALDAIPEPARTPGVRMSRARCLARLIEISRAFDALSPVIEPGCPAKARLWFAQIATVAGHVDVAARALQPLLTGADEPSRMLARISDAFVAMHRGDSDRARQQLREAAVWVRDPLWAGILAFWEGYSFWITGCEPDPEPIRRARTLLASSQSRRGRLFLAMAEASLLAHEGRLDEAEATLPRLETFDGHESDMMMQLAGRFFRALLMAMQGHCDDALAILVPACGDLLARGHLVGGSWVQITAGRVLLGSGKRAAGLRMIETASAAGAALGLGCIVEYGRRSRLADPLELLAATEPPAASDRSRWPIDVSRARALFALRLAANGAADQARSLARSLDPGDRDDRALERTVLHLTFALALHGEGRVEAAALELGRARDAATGTLDDDLVPLLQARLGRLWLVTHAGARLVATAPRRFSRRSVVVDARSHHIVHQGRVIELDKRPILRQILYTLARRPGLPVSKESLTTSLGATEYHPLRHDNPLRVNILRLRRLVAFAELRIEAHSDGYRLVVPEDFIYLDPATG